MSESREPELLVIVPTRGRPHNAARVIDAWTATGAFERADLKFAIDADDPEREKYWNLGGDGGLTVHQSPKWQPMVHKLNLVANFSTGPYGASYRYLAFMGDDHVPRSDGWVDRYCDELAEMGTGIVFGNDLVQGHKLCTQWAMTADIVRALGRMVPAPVEHMYCDNSIMELGLKLEIIRYLPDVRIEHAHPVAGRGAWDAGYERVNSREQYRKDHATFQEWLHGEGFRKDVELIKNVIGAQTKETTP